MGCCYDALSPVWADCFAVLKLLLILPARRSMRLRRGTEVISSWEQSQKLRWMSYLPYFVFTQQWPTATKRFSLCAIIRQVRNSPQNLLCRVACSRSSDSMIHQFIWLIGLIEGLKGPSWESNQKKINPDTKVPYIFLKLLLVGN